MRLNIKRGSRRDSREIDRKLMVVFLPTSEAFQCGGRCKLK
jgi:hypothetical protein